MGFDLFVYMFEVFPSAKNPYKPMKVVKSYQKLSSHK